jgi:hypothetical protein
VNRETRLAGQQVSVDMPERYNLNARDRSLLQAATNLLKRVAAAETLRPAELVSVAKLLHVLSILPRVTSDLEVTVQVTGPRREFGEIETLHYWEVAVEGERLSISSGGHFFQPSTGGDSFTTMIWAAIPEEFSDLDDYRQSLWMVPDVLWFPDAVAGVDFASGGYKIRVIDEDNSLLEDDEDPNEEGSDGEPGDIEEEDLSGNRKTPRTWSLSPIDALEERLASTVDADDVDASEPAYAYGVENCQFCCCPPNRRGVFVDGWLRGHLTTGNMCANCFDSRGEGIGWGQGQLYARQPDSRWRRVAGGRPLDAGSRPVVIQCGDGNVFQFNGEKEAQQFEASVTQAGGETFRLVPAPKSLARAAQQTPPPARQQTDPPATPRGQDLWRDLLGKVLSDQATALGLIQFEADELKRKGLPEESFEDLMQRAIDRWERDQ